MDVNSIERVLTDDMSFPFPLKINIAFLVSLKSQSALCYTLSIYPFSYTLYTHPAFQSSKLHIIAVTP